MTWEEFIMWTRGSGINVLIGFALSFIVDWFPQYEAAAPRVKRLVMIGLCLAIPLLGTVLGVVTGVFQPNFQAIVWPAILAGAVAFGSSTVAHTRDLKSV